MDEGKNGFLIDDKDEYEEVLRELINNPEKLLSFKKASRKKAEQFSLEKIVRSYEEALNEILSNP